MASESIRSRQTWHDRVFLGLRPPGIVNDALIAWVRRGGRLLHSPGRQLALTARSRW